MIFLNRGSQEIAKGLEKKILNNFLNTIGF